MPKPPVIHIGRKTHPHYIPALDTLHMPDRGKFDSTAEHYGTFFHELTHATGHETRLARKTLMENAGINAIGEKRKTYSKEELIAEMGGAFLSAHAGIIEENIENSAAYLQGWLKVLKVKKHNRWIVQAASQAHKAADYILAQ